MKYIVLPLKDKSEKRFFLTLFEKIHRKVTISSSEEIDDVVFIDILKRAEKYKKAA